MRHAKSDWGDRDVADHDRSLNRRGIRDAPRMAAWIGQLGDLPDRILCSSAVRTCETSRLLGEAWNAAVPVVSTDSLYLASPETILNVIRQDHGDAETLLVIGHNPGMGSLVSGLAGQIIDMPTAAIAAFEIAGDTWETFPQSESIRLIDTARPKAL